MAVGTSEHTEVYRVIFQKDFRYPDAPPTYQCEPLIVLECPALQGGVAFSNKQQIAIGGNQLVSVFDVETGGMLVKEERDVRVRCVALSSDGSCLVTGGFDKKVHMQMIERGTQLYYFSYDNKASVKSIDLSSDATQLAIGCDSAGKGCVVLFDANDQQMRHAWDCEKAIWAVRFSSDAKALAAAGFDMALTLYSTVSLQAVQKIKYTPLGGPAFIWSLEWSSDSSRLILGCWNTHAFVYAFNPTAVESGSADEKLALVEVSKIKRTDRVYAVALDEHGENCVVAGRDKKIAMYDIDRGEGRPNPFEQVEPVLMWEVGSEDFIYCVALSNDMQYVSFGGTAKKAVVLSARSGTKIFEIAQPGVIWSLAMLNSPSKGWLLAVGGELPVISVIRIEGQQDVLQLPVNETTFDISMTNDSLGYTNGARTTMLGAGGQHYGWDEKPSFQVVAGLIMSLLSVEHQLLKTVKLIIDHHPSVINLSAPEVAGGGSLLHFIILNTNHPDLLELMLSADCRIAMALDRYDRSLMKIAVENGKWRSLQLILSALHQKRFSVIPTPMHVVNESLQRMAYKYPLDFLSFLSKLELQCIPEILGEIDASDVMLPHRLIKGTQSRCPKGIWNEDLQEFRVVVESEDRDDTFAESSTEASVVRVQQKALESNGKANRGALSQLLHRAMEAGGAQDQDSSRNSLSEMDNVVMLPPVAPESVIEMGYSTVITAAGVQAYRVPLENFAALPSGGGITPLQLIVEAVSASTRSDDAYSIFGSTLVEILLEFKWTSFARRKYSYELVQYIIHVVLILTWNVTSNRVIIEDKVKSADIIMRLEEGDIEMWLIAVLFVWTTLKCVNIIWLQISEFQRSGVKVFYDPWNLLELLYIVCQLLVNALFWVNEYIFESVQRVGDEDSRVNVTEILNPVRRNLGGSLEFFHDSRDSSYSHGSSNDLEESFLLRHSPWHARMLKGASASTASIIASYPGGIPSGYYASAYVILQALVALISWIRLLYYFKGILRLGTLVHSLQRIVMDIYPLLALIFVLFIAFWSSIWMLINVELEAEYNPDWKNIGHSMIKMWNMGMYTDFDSNLSHHSRDPILGVFYETYMFVLQIILLNMLIALMAESNDRVRSIAKLVAQFERAKLILRWERRLASMSKSKSCGASFIRVLAGFPSGRGASAIENIFPKWLHVLMPAENGKNAHSVGLSGDALAEEALKVAQTNLEKGNENHEKLARALATNNEETRRLSALLVDTQEKHGNMLRELSRDIQLIRGSRRGILQGFQERLSSPMSSVHRSPTGSRSASIEPKRKGASDQGSASSNSWLSNMFGPGKETDESETKREKAAPSEASKPEPKPEPKQEPKPEPNPVGSSNPAVPGVRLESKKRSMPVPEPLKRLQPSPTNPSKVIGDLLQSCAPGSMSRATEIATRIRDPSYDLKQYYADIQAAFPELRLYFIESTDAKRASVLGFERKDTTSGIESLHEYLRTVGAFFAVYWLMRIGIDGERGFSFGVDDETWVPLTPEQIQEDQTQMGSSTSDAKRRKQSRETKMDPQALFFAMGPVDRSLAFYKNTSWGKLNDLMCEAGLMAKTLTGYRVVVDRVVGLLALTAIHDIMKIDLLLPTVQPQHAPYCGFAQGDRINDHDIALGYILEHYSNCLPSFSGLGKDLQQAIKFTQVKLGFNHGWLVQAEAPPGPLFTSFKRAISASAAVKPSDVSFYFVHWLTDLAGAEPTPLKGSEKFVLKFPHPVLHSFISSFSLVGSLVNLSETAVFEKFLLEYWNASQDGLGEAPRGAHAVALMRLVAQVQHLPLQQRLLTGYDKLSQDDKDVLSSEMALTGCAKQDYACNKIQQGGPVFLVYYSPAFLRVAARSDAASGLHMLAEVYRQARSLWPFDQNKYNEHVTIRVDQIKEHTPQHIMDGHLWGEGWLLVKHNDREAIVEHHPLYTLNTNAQGQYRVLAFWQMSEGDDDDFITELQQLRKQRMQAKGTSRSGAAQSRSLNA